MLFIVSADFRKLFFVVGSQGRFGGGQHKKQVSGGGGEQDEATSRPNLVGSRASVKRYVGRIREKASPMYPPRLPRFFLHFLCEMFSKIF